MDSRTVSQNEAEGRKMCAPLECGEESSPVYIFKFEDASREDIVLNCSREEAIQFWKDKNTNWNCWLFEPVVMS